MVAVVRRCIRQAVNALVGDERLSPQQFWTLIAVAEQAGLSLGELAERRHMDQPAASRVVYTLTRRGSIAATVDPEDRRRLRLGLTADGRRLAKRLVPAVSKIRAAIDSSLSAQERAAVVNGLRKIIARLEQIGTVSSVRISNRTEAKGHGRSRSV